MRVGFFSECYRPIVNGVVASIDASREALRRAGHEVVCVAPRAPRHRDRDASIVRLPSLPLPTSSGYRLALAPRSSALDRALGAIDVAHAHSLFITGEIAARYARKHAIPLVLTYHTRLDLYAHYAPFETRLARRALAARTRRYAGRAAVVVVPTRATERHLRATGVVAPIAVLPSAIDVARFAAGRRSEALRARLGAAEGAPLALAVARLAREKNLEPLVAMLALAPQLRLAILGEGALRGTLERLARRAGVAERLRLPGALSPGEMPDAYASADVLVSTSLSETQGLVLVEALAAGLPVVAVETPQAAEVLGGAGRLVPPAPAALAAAVAEIVAHPPAQSAIQLASARYSLEVHARRLTELYEGIRRPSGR